MKENYTIYMHITPSGKVYIGQTRQNPNKRWNNGKGYLNCKLFYNSIKKYGWGNISHKILHTNLSKDQADILEKMYIQFFKRKNISLNITDGGEGTPGHIVSTETRKKISAIHKGKILTEETKRKISESTKGKGKCHTKGKQKHRKHLTDEHRKKISEAQKGKRRGPCSEETKRKISESLKGKQIGPFSAERREKMKGRDVKRSIWLNEFNEEVEMANNCVARHHKNWVKVRDL